MFDKSKRQVKSMFEDGSFIRSEFDQYGRSINEFDQINQRKAPTLVNERNLIAAKQTVAFVRQRDGDAAALCEAVRFGLHDLTAELLSEGVHPDTRVTNEMTPLMFCGNRAIGELLVKAGADVNSEDSNGRTPLIWFTLGLQRKQSGIAYLKWIVRSGDRKSVV